MRLGTVELNREVRLVDLESLKSLGAHVAQVVRVA